MSLPPELKKGYRKQKYSLVGNHSAVKTCHWLRRSLNSGGEENCYKHKFYGIPTHRCLQMTPSLGHCTQTCMFCWRSTPETIGVKWNQTQALEASDPPEFIISEAIKAHRIALSGFGGNPNVVPTMLKEANTPIHAAISLEGEPTLYPRLSELLECFYNVGFKSVFIVTNGTRPKILSGLDVEPTQLYVSVCAPDKETYEKTCRPMVPRAWDYHLETLELLDSFKCPTVLRNTLVPKLNMNNVKGYAKLLALANSTYVEPKAAMSVGAARMRFGYEDMAWHKDIKRFSQELASESGYKIIDEHKWSNIFLLSKLDKTKKLYKEAKTRPETSPSG